MGDNFDIGFKLLPPDLQMKLWVLGLDANTSKVAIAYRPGSFVTSLAYNYGGNVQASLSVRGVTSTVGVNPSNGNVDLGLVYRGFNFGTSASYTQKSVGLNFGYGSQLLPFPSELSDVFNAANGGLQSMASDISAAPNNPLARYKLHSNDAAAIGKAVDAGQKINKFAGPGDQLGVGLRLNYSQPSGLTIWGGLQLKF